MTYEERLAAIETLKKENRGILATPLMSDGNISPMQVGLMSPRQKATWQDNVRKKLEIECRIRDLMKTDEELAEEKTRYLKQKREERISQLLRQKQDIWNVGRELNGKLRRKFCKTMELVEEELKALREEEPIK